MNQFESGISDNQRLTFDYIENQLRRVARIEPEEAFVIRNDDGRYNNFALMLSDQCPWHIEIQSIYGTVAVTEGSILGQYIQALDIIESMNPKIYIPGRPVAGRKYPCDAIREALENAVIHMNYGLRENIQVVVLNHSISILSPGIIFRKGHRDIYPRNMQMKKLFNVMGKSGPNRSGFREIRTPYINTEFSPVIMETREMDFIVILPEIMSISRSYECRSRKIVRYLRGCRG